MNKDPKKSLRIDCKTIIKNNITKIRSPEIQLSIVNKLSKLIDLLKVKEVGIYYPNQYEINILALLQLRTDIVFSLPKIIGEEIIYSKYNLNDQLIINKFKIYETKNTDQLSPNLIFIPGLAFNINGYRLGYGGGFFDRYLTKHPTIFSAGICITELLLEHLPINAFDQKVNYIITE